MLYVVNHVYFILLFSFFPLAGFVIQKYISEKAIWYVIYICIVLLLPIISGYDYVMDNAYGIFIYIILMCGYGLFLLGVQRKLKATLKHTAIICPICLFLGFMGAFAGTITIEREWNFKNFKIAYIRNQGFSGGPLMTYKLSKYGRMPIFIKYIDTKVDNDTTGSCWVKFAEAEFNFNKCNKELSYIGKK